MAGDLATTPDRNTETGMSYYDDQARGFDGEAARLEAWIGANKPASEVHCDLLDHGEYAVRVESSRRRVVLVGGSDKAVLAYPGDAEFLDVGWEMVL